MVEALPFASNWEVRVLFTDFSDVFECVGRAESRFRRTDSAVATVIAVKTGDRSRRY